MSVYTHIERSELEDLLQGYEMGALVDFEGIGEGIDNTNYFVDTTQGRWVLTLFERLTFEELPFFLDWMQALSDADVPAAKPMANKKGELVKSLHNKPTVFFSFVKGRSLTTPTPEQCRTVGVCLGKMHQASQSFSKQKENPRDKDWIQDQIQTLLPLVDTKEGELLKQGQQLLDELLWDALPLGVIHADLFKDNVLFDGDDIAGVIDFYDSCTGPMAYDLAIAYNAWCFDEHFSLSKTRAEALLEGYQSIRPITVEEISQWQATLAAGALRWWVGRLLGKHFPKTGDFVPEKNPREMQAIFSHHLRQAPALV